MKDCTINQHVDSDGNTFSGSGDVQSNSFASHGGQMNIAQGTNSIGQQINNYNSQLPAQPVIPRQLPAPEHCFLHREEELVWLNDRLHPGKVVAVCGPGGMGKSALAAQAVSKLEPGRFPDGIIFHSFYHQPSTDMALQTICNAFQVEAKAGLASTVRQALAGRKALLILDGTEEADDLPALLRLRGGCGVLITSRKRTDALADRLDLKPLDEQPAAEVFRLYSGVAADDAGVQGICTLLGGWPVALRIAGRYLSTTGESAADYLQWLEQEPFKELGDGEHQEENAALLLRRSVEKVSDDARLALGVAGTLAFAPIAREPVAAVIDGDVRRASKALGLLVNYGLLERKGECWQVSHALIHTYAREELALSKDRLERLAKCYIFFCSVMSKAGVDGYARLNEERTHCLRLMHSCLNSELWEEVQYMVIVLQDYLDRQCWWTEKLAGAEMVLTIARQEGNRKKEGVFLHNLAHTYWKRGDCEKALIYLEQSLIIARGLGDRSGEGLALSSIATIYQEQGKYELSLEQYKQSLSILREIGYQEGEGVALNNIGQIYYYHGEYETALQYYEQALAIGFEVSNGIGIGQTLNNIAEVYRMQGDTANALGYQYYALATRQKFGDKAGEAVTYGNIGLTYKDIGDLAKAEEYISHAVRIAETIGHPALEQFREGLAQVQAARRG